MIGPSHGGAFELLLRVTHMDATEGKKYIADLLKKTGEEFRAGSAKEHAELAGVTPVEGAKHVEMIPGDEPLDSKDAWTADRIAADPDGYFDAHIEQFKAKYPGSTVEQIRNEWKYASNLMGYAPLT